MLVGELPLGVPDVAAEEGAVGAPVTQGATACVPQKHRGHGQVLVIVIIQLLAPQGALEIQMFVILYVCLSVCLSALCFQKGF